MRVVFMGSPDFAVAALARLPAAHEVVAAYCQPPKPAKRGLEMTPTAVEVFARAHAIPVCTPKSLKTSEAAAIFAAWQADVAVVAAYGLILPAAVLAAPRMGCVNIHASLLPRWRGAAPIQRAIIAGDTETGITIMQMDVGLDTGPMLLQQAIPIADDTTAGVLHDQLAELGAALILPALDGLADGSLVAKPQPEPGVTYAAKIDKAETQIDFNRPAVHVLRHIHGLSPAPGAWFLHGGERIKVLRAERAWSSGAAGTVLDDCLAIGCADGAIRPLILQRAGRGAQPAAEFLRGYTFPPGTRL